MCCALQIEKVSSSHWTATEEAPAGEYGNEAMCSQFCLLKGDSCVGFRSYDGGRCEVGHLSDWATLDPENGLEVHVRPSNASFVASPVTVVNNGLHLWSVDPATAALALMPSPTNVDDVGLVNPRAYGNYYKGGILMCESEHSYIHFMVYAILTHWRNAAKDTGMCKRFSLHKKTWKTVQSLPR